MPLEPHPVDLVESDGPVRRPPEPPLLCDHVHRCGPQAERLQQLAAAGAEITVRNVDGVGHTVTADEGEAFDVVVGPGSEVTFTAPTEEGEYPFHCTPHPAMTGTLVVEGDGS